VGVKSGVGGYDVCVAGRVSGVDVEAGMTINATDAGVRDGRPAAGRIRMINVKVEHRSTEAMIRMAYKTLRVNIFFILVWFT
jgi:hypothetical protein